MFLANVTNPSKKTNNPAFASQTLAGPTLGPMSAEKSAQTLTHAGTR